MSQHACYTGTVTLNGNPHPAALSLPTAGGAGLLIFRIAGVVREAPVRNAIRFGPAVQTSFITNAYPYIAFSVEDRAGFSARCRDGYARIDLQFKHDAGVSGDAATPSEVGRRFREAQAGAVAAARDGVFHLAAVRGPVPTPLRVAMPARAFTEAWFVAHGRQRKDPDVPTHAPMSLLPERCALLVAEFLATEVARYKAQHGWGGNFHDGALDVVFSEAVGPFAMMTSLQLFTGALVYKGRFIPTSPTSWTLVWKLEDNKNATRDTKPERGEITFAENCFMLNGTVGFPMEGPLGFRASRQVAALRGPDREMPASDSDDS